MADLLLSKGGGQVFEDEAERPSPCPGSLAWRPHPVRRYDLASLRHIGDSQVREDGLQIVATLAEDTVSRRSTAV